MNENLLLIPIETKVREYHGKMLFALAAAERGFSCIIGEQGRLRRAMSYLDNGLFIDKSIADTKREWLAHCQALGNRIVSWDEEGLVFFNRESYCGLRICDQNFMLLDAFFAWGENQATAIHEHTDLDEKKIYITGNPRFDMLRPELRSFYDESVKMLRKRYGRIILINTTFPMANHFQDIEILNKQFIRYPLFRTPGFLKGFIESQHRAFESFKKILPLVAAEYPNHTIIVRPHPSENRDTWREQTASLSNATVEADGNVIEWILAAEVLLHSSCTTGIEAFYLDIPTIGWRNGGDDCFEQPLPNALSLQAYTLEEMMDHVKVAIDKRNGNSMRKNKNACHTAAANISGMEGNLACDRILDVLETLDCRRRKRPWMAKMDRWARDKAADIRMFIETRGRENLSYTRQKFAGLSFTETIETQKRLQAATGRFYGLTISPVCDSCFLIRK